MLIWSADQANVSIIQATPLGDQMNDVSVEWSKDSRKILLKQPIAGSDQKSVWIATVDKSEKIEQ